MCQNFLKLKIIENQRVYVNANKRFYFDKTIINLYCTKYCQKFSLQKLQCVRYFIVRQRDYKKRKRSTIKTSVLKKISRDIFMYKHKLEINYIDI